MHAFAYKLINWDVASAPESIIIIDICILINVWTTNLSFQLEEVYKKAHAAIRADPSRQKKEHKKAATKKRWNAAKLTLAQRQQKVADRKAAFLAKLKAEADA